ncbi:MAG: DUF1460 domain-containing protein [Bacteroidia bacterium]|nr:DUF1460 domain-containing protein [Bacteroidia bacterium]
MNRIMNISIQKNFFIIFFSVIFCITAKSQTFTPPDSSFTGNDTIQIIRDSLIAQINLDTSILVFSMEDIRRFYKLADSLLKCKANEKPLNEIVIETAMSFLNIKYSKSPSNLNLDNKLIINLSGFDCVTYIENVLAISRIVKQKKNSFVAFAAELQKIRFRNGNINEFPSRLHYFSDWIYDNDIKKIASDITCNIDTTPYNKTVNYMTKNKNKYPSLYVKDYYEQIGAKEKEISARKYCYIPKLKVQEYEDSIKDGDIIAITTATTGLDISHVGFAIHKNGKVHLLHASTTGNKVIISEKILADYLKANKMQTGIMVARIIEPD